MVYPRYQQMFPDVKAVRDSLELSYFKKQHEVEEEALRLYKNNKAEAIQYLNQYSNETAQQMLNRWKQLAIFLIVKYNDMAVKPVKNGQFTRTKTGLGSRVKRPGFPASYAKEIVRRTGDKYLVPSEK